MNKYTLEELMAFMNKRDSGKRILPEEVGIAEYVKVKLNEKNPEADLDTF